MGIMNPRYPPSSETVLHDADHDQPACADELASRLTERMPTGSGSRRRTRTPGASDGSQRGQTTPHETRPSQSIRAAERLPARLRPTANVVGPLFCQSSPWGARGLPFGEPPVTDSPDLRTARRPSRATSPDRRCLQGGARAELAVPLPGRHVLPAPGHREPYADRALL